MKLVECVPNFSEGRDKRIIEEIVNSIKEVEGIKVLNVDISYDANRTVVTFIGEPEAVKEAAFRGIKRASELIDMRKHKGAHPRIGATDVCPIIPLKNITFEECNEIVYELAKRVGEELSIPVYLYEKSARIPERRSLSYIREGEYEGLPYKILKPEWKPDFGPQEFNAKSGATVIGVREFLIAYNINLNTKDKRYADDIAFEIREKGRSKRTGNIYPFYFKGEIVRYKDNEYPCGECDFVGKTLEETYIHVRENHNYDLYELLKLNNIDINDVISKPVKKRGLFKNVRAIGWYIEEYKRAQVSINLTDYNVTNMHHVFEAVEKLAEERGLKVTGSEIVGLVPFKAIYEVGKFYLERQKASKGLPVKDVLETAIQSLGLRDVSEFEIEKKVLGLPDIFESNLPKMKIWDFSDELSRPSPVPGGGSAGALSGAIGASLCCMAINITISKLKDDKNYNLLSETSLKLQELKDYFLVLMDKDSESFKEYMEVLKTKKDKESVNKALYKAIEIPFDVSKNSILALKLVEDVVELIDENVISDLGCGINMLNSSFRCGIFNMLINLKNLDEEIKLKYREEIKNMKLKFENLTKKLENIILEKLEGGDL
ncbi:MAG: glutamate formimidoyltransferase [Candidatus Hydrothermales bacterium]